MSFDLFSKFSNNSNVNDFFRNRLCVMRFLSNTFNLVYTSIHFSIPFICR